MIVFQLIFDVVRVLELSELLKLSHNPHSLMAQGEHELGTTQLKGLQISIASGQLAKLL